MAAEGSFTITATLPTRIVLVILKSARQRFEF